jgi:hypothetical protein
MADAVVNQGDRGLFGEGIEALDRVGIAFDQPRRNLGDRRG